MYPRTPRGPPPVLYANVGTAPYPSPGSHYPPQVYHVARSEPHSRGHHRSSSRSRSHRRSHSSGGSRRHRGRHRSSTPSYSIPAHYSPAVQPTPIPSTRHRRHSYSVPRNHYHNASHDPHRHYGHNDQRYLSHRGESIGERIKRFFGIGIYGRSRYPDHAGHQSRPMYPW